MHIPCTQKKKTIQPLLFRKYFRQTPVSVAHRQRHRNFTRASCHPGHSLCRTFMDALIARQPDIKADWMAASPRGPIEESLNGLLTLKSEAFHTAEAYVFRTGDGLRGFAISPKSEGSRLVWDKGREGHRKGAFRLIAANQEELGIKVSASFVLTQVVMYLFCEE